MITLKTDQNNDLVQDANGNLVLFGGIDAELQEAKHYAATSRGEMIYQFQDGIPFDPLAFGATPLPVQYAAAVRARLEQAPWITEVVSVEATQNGGLLSYNASIKTLSGIAFING